MRISDWSSDVCSSDLRRQQASAEVALRHAEGQAGSLPSEPARQTRRLFRPVGDRDGSRTEVAPVRPAEENGARAVQAVHLRTSGRQGSLNDPETGEEVGRSEEHTSELQSLMRISYVVFCLNKKQKYLLQ